MDILGHHRSDIFCITLAVLAFLVISLGVFIAVVAVFPALLFIPIGTLIAGFLLQLIAFLCIVVCHRHYDVICWILLAVAIFLIVIGILAILIPSLTIATIIVGIILIILGLLALLLAGFCFLLSSTCRHQEDQ